MGKNSKRNKRLKMLEEESKRDRPNAEEISNEQKKKPKTESPVPDSLHKKHHSPHRRSPPVQSRPPPRVPKESGLDLSKYPPTMPIEEVVSKILKKPPAMGVESALQELVHSVSVKFVEDVLKLSYGAGREALKFFQWATRKLDRKHSSLSWNLLVDLLGKEKLFDDMWDCIKVMKTEGIVSIETFSSVFSNYCQADKVDEAKGTFEVMELYGCRQDVVALNCLLSALCRYKRAKSAMHCFASLKEKVTPDADTYALLLEGCENENNVLQARTTFGEMIFRIGWLPSNTAAYNAFLSTLINGSEIEEALGVLAAMKTNKCLPDLGFFRKTLKILYQRKNAKDASKLWELMTQSGIVPDMLTYNTMIGVCCSANPSQVDLAYRLLDEMVFSGAFPDSMTYNTMFEALITARKVEEASSIFREMTKNECCPLYANYVMAIQMYCEAGDPEKAILMWKHMIQKAITPKSDCASILIDGLCDLGRVSEARKYCLDACTRGVTVPSRTMKKLQSAMTQAGKQVAYEQLVFKIKTIHQPK